MSLQDKLGQEIKSAMLARDADRLGALRMLKSAVGYIQIEKKVETLPDAEFIAAVQKEVKKRRDSIEQFEKGGRRTRTRGVTGNERTLAITAQTPPTASALTFERVVGFVPRGRLRVQRPLGGHATITPRTRRR